MVNRKVTLVGASQQARPFVVGVRPRYEREYVPLRERMWDPDSETFRELPRQRVDE